MSPAVIFGNPLPFQVRIETGSAGSQLAFFLRLRGADWANEIQGRNTHLNPLSLLSQHMVKIGLFGKYN
jgi:hypothetical protein